MPHTRVVAPSAEVRAEARRRAIRIARGLHPRQLESALASGGAPPAGFEPVADGRSA